MNLKKLSRGFIICSLCAVYTSSQAQITTNTFGKGIDFMGKDSSFFMNAGMRFQQLYTNDWDVVNDDFGNITNHTSNFLLRRARLKFKGYAFNPKFQYKIEMALTNRDMSGGDSPEYSNASRLMLDAVVKWNFAGNFWLWAGQTKLPGNRERVISSANMQMVDRSRLNSRFNIDRDMGIQLRHKKTFGKQFIVEHKFALSQGEGRNLTSGNIGGYNYTYRLEILPFGKFKDYSAVDLKREKKPKLGFGIAYDINERAGRNRGQNGSFINVDPSRLKNLNTLFADFMFKYKGLSIMGEYALREVSGGDNQVFDITNTLVSTYYTGQAVNLQAGLLLKNNWEPSVRFTYMSPTSSNKENEYTIGLSRYVVGHKLKFQADLSYRDVLNSDDKLFYRMQVDLHF
ncbi:OprO/OprP family phosphate-selective porin [Flavobacteriales bacterium]|nr:OprO/OprP family phosphate-selective porin [Flavobacteriales bacterium]MDB4052168.1 OprO/OprP family phosphate-selective porin [Flavobacteriales bacterium]MDC1370306.1 OprO/OprP family phosphate-selective porin [Flavobacteriales bacterium]